MTTPEHPNSVPNGYSIVEKGKDIQVHDLYYVNGKWVEVEGILGDTVVNDNNFGDVIRKN
jgi:hypothetical protein